jgi:Ran GTPase-activating protein (RanGAP) involved in mRNA processing and transport
MRVDILNREERILVKNDPKVRLFLELMKESRTNAEACFSGPPALGRAIAKNLPLCSSLVTLDLSGGSLGDNGTSALARALMDPATVLKRLDLESNNIGPSALRELGDALTLNQTLVALSLENNNLSGDYQDYTGLRALGSALTSNNTLASLNLNRGMLGVNGLAVFATALQSNTTIVVLDVDFNGNVKQSDVSALLAKLEDNKVLLREREATEAEENEKRKRITKLHAEQERKRQDEEQESKEADERARQRQEDRVRKYEAAKEAKRVFLEEAHAKAYERQAEFDEANQKKGKGKKKK